VAVKEGWKGRVYEDFEVGDIYVHPLGRTVLSVDNSWFTLLTQNVNPIPFRSRLRGADRVRQAARRFDIHAGARHRPVHDRPLVQRDGQPRVGRSASAESLVRRRHGVFAQRGAREARIKSRPNVGIVKVKTTGFKQDG
jgi:hypothetical protein